MLLTNLNEVLSMKKNKVSSVDQPFCTDELKQLKRLNCREYRKIDAHKNGETWIKDTNKKYLNQKLILQQNDKRSENIKH